MNWNTNKSSMAWNDYLLFSGDDFHSFWEDWLKTGPKDILYILGLGFDPRMCCGIESIFNMSGVGKRECLLIEFEEGKDSPSRQYLDLVKKNKQKLEGIVNGKGAITPINIPMWSIDGKRRVADRKASESICDSTIDGFTDIVVDISSMPRGIYFLLITKILYLLEQKPDNNSRNLHIVTVENVDMDKDITEQGVDEKAFYLHHFSSELEIEATAIKPRIWIPVLGERNEDQLKRIYDLVKPDEICPLLPSPSKNPRRSDDLINEYRELLFDQLRIEPRNIIYASETNPFEVYRQIISTIEHYEEVLMPLEGCKIVISATSSKLLSIGALLAAYDAKKMGSSIGMAHIEAHGYCMGQDQHDTLNGNELFSIWLTGDCYCE